MANSNPKLLPLQCRPKLLKDYLNDDEQHNVLPKIIVLKRSKSKATSTTILAIHKASEIFIKTLKYLPFAIKSPSILPRSISRWLSSSRRRNNEKIDQMEMVDVDVKVKVKDILRWRSSRDLVEEKVKVNATTSESTISMSSKSSSWCDSDCMADDFPSWCHAPPEKATRNSFQGGSGDYILEKSRTMSMDYSKRNWQNDEDDEQYTPVSVLDTPFQEDEYSKFHLSLVNIKGRRCAHMEMIKEFESLSEVKPTNLERDEFSTDDEQQEKVNEAEEEKEMKLLNYFREENSGECYGHVEENLLLDFFMHEQITSRRDTNGNLQSELIKSAHDWLHGMYGELFEWEKEGNRISYIKGMEKGVNWEKFEEEQEEMALQVEKLILSSLVNELLIDLF